LSKIPSVWIGSSTNIKGGLDIDEIHNRI
jgi:hypothetical protein